MDDFGNLAPGMTRSHDVVVDNKLTTSRTGAPVLSTPMMIWQMEIVCAEMVDPLLPPGFTTVGYEVSVKHRAPAFSGARLQVWCRLLEADGRKLLFEVKVSEGEKTIGEGQHRRTIVPLAPE